MNRIQSVDAIRVLAIVSVIVIHTAPFQTQPLLGEGELYAAIIINQVARFAVPFFFILSGYFWALKFSNDSMVIQPTLKVIKRIALIFIAWSLIYSLPLNLAETFSVPPLGPITVMYEVLITAFKDSPLDLILEGTKVHLWYLMSLLLSLAISAVFLRFQLRLPLLVLAVILFAIGLAGKAYRDTPLGFIVAFNFRDGPFFSLIFFVTGYFLQRRGPSDKWLVPGIFLTVLGLIMHFTELMALHRFWGTSMLQDYVLGTYFMGLGVALIALSNTKYLHLTFLTYFGPFVLGIYVSHLGFITLLKPLNRKYAGDWIWELTYILLVFLLSYLLTFLLSKFRFTRKIVI